MSPGTGIILQLREEAPASPPSPIILFLRFQLCFLDAYACTTLLSSWRTDSFFVQNASCSINNIPVLYSEGVYSLPSVLI